MAFSLKIQNQVLTSSSKHPQSQSSSPRAGTPRNVILTHPLTSLSPPSSAKHLAKSTSFIIKASSSLPTAVAEPEGIKINSIPTKPIEGQKTGTSGLRKKNELLVLGGDGRYFNREASQTIIKIAAGNGVGKILVGRDGIMSTPAVSAVIRKQKANGGFIMSASHNPGGPEYDWGHKEAQVLPCQPFHFNYNSGQPAPESITDKIYGNILSIKMAEMPDVDLSCLGVTKYGNFSVEVVDPVSDYLELMEDVFDFELIKGLISQPDFRFILDAMHADTGAYAKPMLVDKLGANPVCRAYAKPMLVDKLGANPDSIANGIPLEDFGLGHPDPNLTYAKDLVNIMYSENGPDFGAASDGRGFFVTPSDSVAIIAANSEAIPYFKSGSKGLARSMPTSGALDRVAKKLNLAFFEESCQYVERKVLELVLITSVRRMEYVDRAILAWLSIIAHQNKDKKPGEKLVSVSDVVMEHCATYGRNFFSRYDYEECESEGANKMIEYLRDLVSKSKPGEKYGSYVLDFADDFKYTDPVDGSTVSKQGVRFVFSDGSRIIFRLSGTGSAGATVRVCVEQFEPDTSKHDLDAQIALKPLIDLALSLSKLKEFTGRENPTVIT